VKPLCIALFSPAIEHIKGMKSGYKSQRQMARKTRVAAVWGRQPLADANTSPTSVAAKLPGSFVVYTSLLSC